MQYLNAKTFHFRYTQKILFSNKISWRNQFSVHSVYRDIKSNLDNIDFKTYKYPFLMDFKRKVYRIEKIDEKEIEKLITELKDRMSILMDRVNKNYK